MHMLTRAQRWTTLAIALASGALLIILYVQTAQPVPEKAPVLAPRQGPHDTADVVGNEPIIPIPLSVNLPPERVALGKRLFEDTRLSRDNSIACATCHRFNQGGTDGHRFSTGIGGAVGDINAPTVFNSGFNFVQFWDGRASSLEEQAAGPIQNPVEMGSTWDMVVTKISADADYRKAFGQLYDDGITPQNIQNAIATFERSLQTPDSRFDRYLRGDAKALSAIEIDGYRRFKEYGCASCHQGVMVGGNLYQRFGIMHNPLASRSIRHSDLGRYNVTGKSQDRHVFKVPGLRNVDLTAPYFHDGSAATLEEAVKIMGKAQLGRELSAEDVTSIVAFLRTLTGKLHGEMLH